VFSIFRAFVIEMLLLDLKRFWRGSKHYDQYNSALVEELEVR